MENYIIQNLANDVFGSVRFSLVNGVPYFCLTDICEKLGLNSDKAVYRIKNGIESLLCDQNTLPSYHEGRGIPIINIPTEVQTGVRTDGTPALQVVNMVYVTEPGVYYTVFQSRKPEAEMFKSWVFSVLLPTVRQIGFNESVQALQQYNMRLQQEVVKLGSDYDNQQICFNNQSIDYAFACTERNRYRSNIESADFLTDEQRKYLLNLED